MRPSAVAGESSYARSFSPQTIDTVLGVNAARRAPISFFTFLHL